MKNKILIIGAGFLGLGIASRLKKNNIPYDQVDKENRIGGIWNNGVYDFAKLITYKKNTEFSDYPMPSDYPDYPNRNQVLEYLENYAKAKLLLPSIELCTKVNKITYSYNGTWIVDLENGDRRNYKGVIICTGANNFHSFPKNLDLSEVRHLHTSELKNFNGISNQKILIIGTGNSAAEFAIEGLKNKNQVDISSKEGAWVIPKKVFGIPYSVLLPPSYPLSLRRIVTKIYLGIRYPHLRKVVFIKPKHNLFEASPIVNTAFIKALANKEIQVKPAVKYFNGNKAYFCNGQSQKYDLIIIATGFKLNFPFLSKDIISFSENGIPNLIYGVFHKLYKNFYLTGWQKLQYGYGVGRLAIPLGDFLCLCINKQDQLSSSIGTILGRNEIGLEEPKSYIDYNPNKFLSQISKLNKLILNLND